MKSFDENLPKKYIALDGIFNYDNIYRDECHRIPQNGTFVELGVWKGRSISYFGEYCNIINKKINIHGVDFFECKVPGEMDWGNSGISEVRKSLDKFGLHHINLIKSDTAQASKLFENKSIDFVWVDASHEKKSVIKDILAWWPKIKYGGTLAGHDINWSGVSAALKSLGFRYKVDGTSWTIKKPPF